MVRGVRVKVCGVAWGAVHGCMVAIVVFSGAMSIELSAACNWDKQQDKLENLWDQRCACSSICLAL